MYDICITGSITRDTIYHDGGLVRQGWGGVPFYAGRTVSGQGARVCIVTRVGRDDISEVVSYFERQGINVIAIPVKSTLQFSNHTFSGDDDRREQLALAAKDQIYSQADCEHIPKARAIIVGPLLKSEMSSEFVAGVHRKNPGALVALDAQGLLRGLRDDRVIAVQWADWQDVFSSVAIVKLSRSEAALVCPGMTCDQACRHIAQKCGCETIVTMGADGAWVATYDTDSFHVPAYTAGDLVDTTGCGDVFLATYVWQRLQDTSVFNVARVAAQIAGMPLDHRR